MTTAALKAAATGQVPAEQARNPYDQLRMQLEARKTEFAKLVGAPNADRFIRVVLTAVMATPRLLECSRQSLIAASLRCAQDGLLPDGREAVLNIYSTKVSPRGQPPYWEDRAQYLPMVGGLVKKLYAGGEVTYVDATVVYQGDHFRFLRGDEPKLEHEPRGQTTDVIAAYAVVKLKNGEIKREVMWKHDLEKVRAASKSKDSGPWATWYEEMCIKSVIKRIYKQLPHAEAFDIIAQYVNEVMGYTPLGAADVAQQALENHASPTLANPTIQQGEKVPVSEPNPNDMFAGTIPPRDDDPPHPDEGGQEGQDGPVGDEQTHGGPQVAAAVIERSIANAKKRDDLDLQEDLIRDIKDEAVRLRLSELVEQRRKELKK